MRESFPSVKFKIHVDSGFFYLIFLNLNLNHFIYMPYDMYMYLAFILRFCMTSQ